MAMATPAACPIDGKSDKTQKVTEISATESSWLREQLKRPEIPTEPKMESVDQVEHDAEEARHAWEASVHQAVAAQTLWDSRLYYCHDHNVVFLAGEQRCVPPEEAQSLLAPSMTEQSASPPESAVPAGPVSAPSVQPAPTQQPPSVDSPPANWEYCDIVARTSTFSVKYIAQAQGPRGTYEAAPEQTVRAALANEAAGPQHSAAVYQMAQQLHANGWEYIGQGSQYWFHYRFRRRIQEQQQAPAQRAAPTLPLPQYGGATPQTGAFTTSPISTAPGSLSDLASTARAWYRGQVSPEDEQRYKDAAGRAAQKAVEAVKSAGHAMQDMATAAISDTPAPPVTDTPTDAESAPTTGFVLVDDDTVAPVQHGGQPSAHALGDEVMSRVKVGVQYVAADHMAHIHARQYGNYLDPSAGQRVKTVLTTIVEMIAFNPLVFIPFLDLIPFLDWYGLGDVITLIEGIKGTTLDGLWLSLLERMIYVVVSLIPFVPARPVVGFYRRVEPWLRNEDTIEQRASSAQMLHTASGAAIGAGWYFLLGQLPPWLRRSIPDSADKRYPRSGSFRARRNLAAFLWVPFIAYFAAAVAFYVALGGGAQTANVFTQVESLFAPGVIAAVALAFIGACVLAQRAYRDRVRESLVLAMRTKPGEAHAEMVGRVNETLWQQGTPISGKLTQSLKHVQDVSIKTAKGIVRSFLKQEGTYAAVAVLLALVAATAGAAVVLAFIGIAA
jgi:hypothetical protein